MSIPEVARMIATRADVGVGPYMASARRAGAETRPYKPLREIQARKLWDPIPLIESSSRQHRALAADRARVG